MSRVKEGWPLAEEEEFAGFYGVGGGEFIEVYTASEGKFIDLPESHRRVVLDSSRRLSMNAFLQKELEDVLED